MFFEVALAITGAIAAAQPSELDRAEGVPAPTAALASKQEEPEGRGPAFTGHWAFRWTRMYEDGSRLVGGGLGVLVGERTRLELVGFGTASPSRYSTLDFRLAYGGAQLDHEVWRAGWFSLGAAVIAGAGSFSVEDRQARTKEETFVGVAEPELFLGVHVGDHLRVTVGGSYRWVAGVEGDIPNRSDGDARGPSLNLRLAVR